MNKNTTSFKEHIAHKLESEFTEKDGFSLKCECGATWSDPVRACEALLRIIKASRTYEGQLTTFSRLVQES